MNEDSVKSKRKAKTEDGPEKKQKLEPAASTTFEVQPEVEVILRVVLKIEVADHDIRTSKGKHYGAPCKTTSAELRRVRISLTNCSVQHNIMTSISVW